MYTTTRFDLPKRAAPRERRAGPHPASPPCEARPDPHPAFLSEAGAGRVPPGTGHSLARRERPRGPAQFPGGTLESGGQLEIRGGSLRALATARPRAGFYGQPDIQGPLPRGAKPPKATGSGKNASWAGPW